MSRAILRVSVAAVCGAVLGGVLLALAYAARGHLAFEMDRDLSSVTSGFYPTERAGDETFAWTSERATIRLTGLDRRLVWACALRARGARSDELPMPTLTLSFDGAQSHATTLSNEFQDIVFDVPPRPERAGLNVAVFVSPTFVPGGGDPRVLGAQIDWFRCRPAGWPRPPSQALGSAAAATAMVAAGAAIVGAPAGVAVVLMSVTAAGLAMLLSTGAAPFGAYPDLVLTMALCAAGLMSAAGLVLRLRRMPLSTEAVVVLCGSVAMALLKLAALSHPGKLLIDALFQAHRLQWVMSRRYFFTQPLPDGVQFPYAIGLYVTAAPWASLLTDHVLLLRTVVVAAEAVAGVLLYLVVARGFGDRLAGVLAILLFHLVPLPFIVIGNANLTNAYAQAVGVMAMAVLVLIAVRVETHRSVGPLVGLALLTALAFLSHVSTFALLAGAICAVAVAFGVFGTPRLRRLAASLIGVVVLAALVSTALYYRHFTDVYTHALSRVRAAEHSESVGQSSGDAPAVLVRQLSWTERAGSAARQTVESLGGAVLVLAVIGAGRLARTGYRQPAALALAAWCGVWLLFLLAGTMTRVDTEYQRYAAEFLGRVNLACYPPIAVLAGLGAAALWRWQPRLWRLCGVALLAVAAIVGIGSWLRWFS